MSLSIAKHINFILSKELKSDVGERLYPITTVKDTDFPFVVYERTSIRTSYTKDGVATDAVTAIVYVLSDNYSSGVSIAEKVRNALEGIAATYDNFAVEDCSLVGADEAFSNNTFIQALTFEFETKLIY
jgi:hypothetical protein